MNTTEIVFTTVNACFTLASVVCAIISIRQTRKQNEYIRQQAETAYKQLEITSKQTEIAQQQLEESQKPNYPVTMRLETIAQSIQRLDGTIKDGINANSK
ncbi:MAG: hypothetical protein Q4E24_15755 [bacterium]|nr:hypothetical protein [bacterium]